MRASTLFSFGLLSFVVPALAEPHAHHGRRHQEVSRRANGELSKRAHSNARMTFYATGLGACGVVNNDNDFIVALNTPEYGSGYPGPNCFKMITISYGGKTTQAQITDQCPGCPFGGLDLSPGLFKFFAPESAGVIYADWSYVSEGGSPAPAPTTSSTWVAPTPTSTWKPDPPTSTSVWVAPTTSSTWKPDPTTSSTSQWVAPTTTSSTWTPDPTTSKAPETTATSSSSSHQAQSSLSEEQPKGSSAIMSEASPSGTPAAPSSSATPSATSAVSNDSTGNTLAALNQAILGMSGVAAAGAQV